MVSYALLVLLVLLAHLKPYICALARGFTCLQNACGQAKLRGRVDGQLMVTPNPRSKPNGSDCPTEPEIKVKSGLDSPNFGEDT